MSDWDAFELPVEPDAKGPDDGLRPRLPICAALVGDAAGYLGLVGVQRKTLCPFSPLR